jgi:hypothetical protein
MKCPKCEHELPEDAFPRHKGKKNGRNSWCRECTNSLARAWYAKNRDRHKHTSTEARRRRVKAGSTKERDARRTYTQVHKGELRFEMSSRVSDAKKRATAKGLKCEITADDMVAMWHLQDGKCALTGWALSLGGGLTDPYCASIDRIQNDLGYVKDNVRLICWMVNKAISAWGEHRFVEMCEAVLGRRSP